MGEFITYEVEDRIGVLTINRPEKRNAMTFAMNADFGRAVGQASEDDIGSVDNVPLTLDVAGLRAKCAHSHEPSCMQLI